MVVNDWRVLGNGPARCSSFAFDYAVCLILVLMWVLKGTLQKVVKDQSVPLNHTCFVVVDLGVGLLTNISIKHDISFLRPDLLLIVTVVLVC